MVRQWCLALGLMLGSATMAAAAEPVALTDLQGAGCRLEQRDDLAAAAGLPAPLAIRCGSAERNDGAVTALAMPLVLPADPSARRALLEKTAGVSAAGGDAAARMTCHPGTWLDTADGLDVLLKPCTLREGNWPQLVVLAAMGDLLVEGEGLPVLLPVIEAAMADVAEYHPPDGKPAFGGRERATDLLAAVYGTQVPLVGTDSHRRYAQLLETARLQDSRRNYATAEDAYRQALIIQEQAFGGSAPGVGTTLMSLALEVSNQGRFEEAAALLHRADPIVARSPNHADQARFFTYSAYDAANAGHFADALRFARAASSIWRDLAGTDSPSVEALSRDGDAGSAIRGELGHSLNLEAGMALRTGDLAGAEGIAREALGIIGEVGGLPPWWKAEVLVTSGEIFAREGRLDKAEESFRGALIIQQRVFGDTAPTAVTLMLLGKVYAGENLDDEALRAYGFALGILARDEYARTGIGFDQIAPLLTAAVRTAGHHPDQRAGLETVMFRALQMVGRGVADDTVGKVSARLAAANPAIEPLVRDLQDAERRRDAARMALAHQTELPDEQRSFRAEDGLLAEINHHTGALETLQRRIKSEFPAYAGLVDQGPVELAEVQKRLTADEALLLFELGREQAFAVVIRADRLVARPLAVDAASVEQTVRDLRKPLQARPDGSVGDFDLAEAHALYRSLFAPIVGDLTGARHLIIVPGGALASLPPALLVTDKPDGGDYRRAAWLVRRFAVTLAPSVRAFATLRQRSSAAPAGRRFLGIGNPAFVGKAKNRLESDQDINKCRPNGPMPALELRELPPLPDTAGELQRVASALGTGEDSLLLGQNATEGRLREQPLEDVRVLYFATHGLLPGELSCQQEPALALSPPQREATAKDQDGLLEASEIAALRLNAELVVLSACNTAQSSRHFGGEALSGLAESFFYAGARTLVASHWQVPSAATGQLMVGMFNRLGADLAGGIAESLRQSQLALINQASTAHPFFWAAFTVIGDGAPRRVPRTVAIGGDR